MRNPLSMRYIFIGVEVEGLRPAQYDLLGQRLSSLRISPKCNLLQGPLGFGICLFSFKVRSWAEENRIFS